MTEVLFFSFNKIERRAMLLQIKKTQR